MKQDVDATGNAVANSYDDLSTAWGVVISGQASTQTGATTWGGGGAPDTANSATSGGDDLAGQGDPSPDAVIGTIMPGDTTGTATVTLNTKATPPNAHTQSGNYSATVILTVAADEQLNP